MLVSHEPNVENVDSPSPQNSLTVCSDFDSTTVYSAPLPEMCSSSPSLSRPAYFSTVSSITQSPQKQINQINNPVTVTNKRSSEEQLFCKRGSKMKKQTIMEKAVDALEQLCSSDQVSSPSQSEILNDSAYAFAQFLATRLRSLSPENRKTCEDEILKLLTRF